MVKKELSFADAVKKNTLTGANSVPIQTRQNVRQNVFSRLSFPESADKSLNKGKAPIGQVHQVGPVRFDRSRILNFGSSSSQQTPAKNLSSALQTRFCSCCLSSRHAREACRSSIRCFACRRGGHISLNYPGDSKPTGNKQGVTAHNGKGILGRPEPVALETDLSLGPGPPAFSSFSAWARSLASTLHAPPPPEPIIILWPSTLMSMIDGPLETDPHLVVT